MRGSVPSRSGSRPGILLWSLFLALGSQGCTLDLTDPFLVDDTPATVTIQLNLTEDGQGEGCWGARVTARPRFQAGQLALGSDSTLVLNDATYLPDPRPHSLSVFVYEVPAVCGPRPPWIALDLPMVEELIELPWPLAAIPLPWSSLETPSVVRVPEGATATITFPGVDLPLELQGQRRLDLTARVVRGPQAPAGQPDHQLLSNLPSTGSGGFQLGAPFTSVSGAWWRVQWGVFYRIDTTLPSGRLNAALQYGVFLFSDVEVTD